LVFNLPNVFSNPHELIEKNKINGISILGLGIFKIIIAQREEEGGWIWYYSRVIGVDYKAISHVE
jgi:hypothetical protein